MKRVPYKKLAAGVIVAATLATAVPSAIGGSVAGNGGATEVTQILNNAELAMQTMQDEIRNLTMMKQLALDAAQNLPLDVADYTQRFEDAKQVYTDLSGAVDATQKLYGAVADTRNLAMWRMNQFAASRLDWKDYVKREEDIAKYRKEEVTWLSASEAASLQVVQTAFKELQKHQDILTKGTSGVHQSTALLNAQMQTLLSLQGTALQGAAQHYQAQTTKMQLDIGEREAATRLADDLKKAQDAANKRSREKLNMGDLDPAGRGQ